MSAIAWQGCSRSLSALMTGMDACCAMVVTVSCAKVRSTRPSTQRSRLCATSLRLSRAPRRDCVWSTKNETPPRLLMPASKVSRVRSEGFSKNSTICLPTRVPRIIRRTGLHGRCQLQRAGQLLRHEVLDRNQVAAGHAASNVRTRAWGNGCSNQCRTSFRIKAGSNQEKQNVWESAAFSYVARGHGQSCAKS